MWNINTKLWLVNSIHYHLIKSLLGQQEVTENVSVLGNSSGQNFLPLLVLRQVHIALHTPVFRHKLLDDAYGRLRLKKESKLNKWSSLWLQKYENFRFLNLPIWCKWLPFQHSASGRWSRGGKMRPVHWADPEGGGEPLCRNGARTSVNCNRITQ